MYYLQLLLNEIYMRLLNLYVVGFWLLNEDKKKNRFIMVILNYLVVR